MNSISTPSQTAQTSASAEVERWLIDYPVDHLQKSNNLPTVQDGAQYAQLKTRLDVFENRLTDVKGTVIAIQGTVRAIRDDVKGLRDDVKGLRSDVSNIRQDVACLNGDITSLRKDIRVIGENIGRQVDSLCNMISNVDSRLNKSRQDQAEVKVKVKVDIKLKTSNKTGLQFQGGRSRAQLCGLPPRKTARCLRGSRERVYGTNGKTKLASRGWEDDRSPKKLCTGLSTPVQRAN